MGASEMGPGAVQALANKLEGLDLTEEEGELLQKLLRRAARYEPEVQGFARDIAAPMQVGSFQYVGLRSGADLTGFARKIGAGSGLVENPEGWPPT